MSDAHWTPLRERVKRRVNRPAWNRIRLPRLPKAPLVFLLRWNHESRRRRRLFRVDGKMSGVDVLYTADHLFATAESVEEQGERLRREREHREVIAMFATMDLALAFPAGNA